MKAPLSWLSDLIDLSSFSHEKIADALTASGLEVEKIEEITPQFSGVLVGKVEEKHTHPNADKLSLLKIDNGKEKVDVVCGDLSIQVGENVAFAPVGAKLVIDDSPLTIDKRSLRGVESYGMLVSKKELGLEKESDEVMRIDDSLKVGEPLLPFFKETIFDIFLTPNLGHCASILGLARELSLHLNIPLKYEKKPLEKTQGDKVKIEILDPDACFNYSYALIEGVKNTQSPLWLKKRIESAGFQSINAIVDSTNYVLMETGQPLHAFDANSVDIQNLRVASKDETMPFMALNDTEYTLPKGSLLIQEGNKPIALAGIMGGKKSSVSDQTTSILLESAYFTPEAVRKTSRKLNLRSESSSRFEKGTDPSMPLFALQKAISLLLPIVGGQMTECDQVIPDEEKLQPKSFSCRDNQIERILGLKLSQGEIETLFSRLGFSPKKTEEGIFTLSIPTYRRDIHYEVDLIEEIGKVYGYDNFEKKRVYFTPSKLPSPPLLKLQESIRTSLIKEGLQECITCNLISPNLSEWTREEEKPLKVRKPSSVDQSVLRTSLLPSLLEVAKVNQNHLKKDLHLFDCGRIHFQVGDTYQELTSIAVLLSGVKNPPHFDTSKESVDFFDLKGIMENVLHAFPIQYKKNHSPLFHPERQASLEINDTTIGRMGQVHLTLLDKMGLKTSLFFAEVHLNSLIPFVKEDKKMRPLPLYPGSERDWTLSLPKEMPIETLLFQVKSIAPPLLKTVSLIDLYEGEKAAEGTKNATLRFTYRNDEKTVQQEEVEKVHTHLINDTLKKMGLKKIEEN